MYVCVLRESLSREERRSELSYDSRMPATRKPVQRSDELAHIVRRFYQAIVAGNIDAIESAFSDDESVLRIGTDSEEWWTTKAAVVGMFRQQFEEADGNSYAAAIEPGDIEAYEEGTIGWVQDQPTFVMPHGATMKGRMTFVFRLEGISWRIVQLHLSFGLPNADTFGMTYLTTLESIAGSVGTERPDLSGVAAGDGTVTIAFTDVEASTEIAERLGDRRWLELLHWHDSIIREQVSKFGGSVVKTQGDGYMLAFGAASSALDFALALQDAMSTTYQGEPVRVRIGLNTGEVIREGDDFYGHAVTVAARVAAQARGNETLATDLVAGIVAGVDRFEFGPPREEELKGLKGKFILRPVIAEAV